MVGVQGEKDGALQRYQRGHLLARSTSNGLNETGNMWWRHERVGSSEEGGGRSFRGTV